MVCRSDNSRLWLGILGVGIALLHLVLIWRLLRQSDQLMLGCLFWGAIASLLWQRRETLRLDSSRLSSFLGLCLMTALLCKSLSLFWFESAFVRLFPGLAALGWILLASGFHFKQYARELILVATLMIPQGLAAQFIHQQTGVYIPTLIAQAATFLLHYAGFNLVRQGTEIILDQQVVTVEYACTGVPMLITLLQLSIVLCLLFSVPKARQILLFAMVGAIAFSLSSVRVMVMVLAAKHSSVFDYWHGVPGSQIFSTLAIGLFILGYQFLIEEPAN